MRERLTRGEGFFELGMFEEAWAETEELPPIDRVEPIVCELRLRVATALEKWELGEALASVLVSSAVQPEKCRETVARFYYARAVALCDAGELKKARLAIRAASDALPDIRLEVIDDERLSTVLGGESSE